MTINITTLPDLTKIELQGKLDTPSTPEAEAKIFPLMEDDSVKNIHIDCSQLTYISSSGLRIFITLQKNFIKTGKTLTLSNLTPAVQAVFDMTGFTNIFHILHD